MSEIQLARTRSLTTSSDYKPSATFTFLGFCSTCRVVYERTGRDSKLRKWLIHSLLPTIDRDSLQTQLSGFPADFVMEIFHAFVQKKGSVSFDNAPKATIAANYYD
jgi:hypothetical protein